MKKTVKKLLIGAGLAVAGLAVYSVWKDAEEPDAVQHTDSNTVPVTPTKEYVERRRQQIRKAAEARRAAQQETVVPPSSGEEMPQDGESLHEAGEKPEGSNTALGEQGAALVELAPPEEPVPPEGPALQEEPAPQEQTEEQQKEN